MASMKKYYVIAVEGHLHPSKMFYYYYFILTLTNRSFHNLTDLTQNADLCQSQRKNRNRIDHSIILSSKAKKI